MKYADFQPTSFDPSGSFLPDRQEWIVGPVTQNRDSDTLTKSNFQVILDDLGGESDNVDVHRFGHWGPGWFEIILCRPGSAEQSKAEEWEQTLADYPVADDEAYSEAQAEAQNETWDSWVSGEFLSRIRNEWEECEVLENEKTGTLIRVSLNVDDIGDECETRAIFDDVADRANVYWETESDGEYIDLDAILKKVTLEDVLKLGAVRLNPDQVPVALHPGQREFSFS